MKFYVSMTTSVLVEADSEDEAAALAPAAFITFLQDGGDGIPAEFDVEFDS